MPLDRNILRPVVLCFADPLEVRGAGNTSCDDKSLSVSTLRVDVVSWKHERENSALCPR